MELAVVGREDFVLGFRLVGIRKAYAAPEDGIEEKIDEILGDKDIGVLVLHTDDMEKLSAPMRRRISSVARPVVIAVGKHEEEDLRAKVRRAIGVDLLK
jgi:V/A-type H+-transporting ATPase subunit F